MVPQPPPTGLPSFPPRAPPQLDGLTGQPRADDILLFAVPVCAPYQVGPCRSTLMHGGCRGPAGHESVPAQPTHSTHPHPPALKPSCSQPLPQTTQVLSSYKFKVKIIPGTLKKGKAVRQAAELLLKPGGGGGGQGPKGPEPTPRERDLIRCAVVQAATHRGSGGRREAVCGLWEQRLAHRITPPPHPLTPSLAAARCQSPRP